MLELHCHGRKGTKCKHSGPLHLQKNSWGSSPFKRAGPELGGVLPGSGSGPLKGEMPKPPPPSPSFQHLPLTLAGGDAATVGRLHS